MKLILPFIFCIFSLFAKELRRPHGKETSYRNGNDARCD